MEIETKIIKVFGLQFDAENLEPTLGNEIHVFGPHKIRIRLPNTPKHK